MHTFRIDWGLPALLQLVQNYEFDTVLDIGSGAGEHKRFLEYVGKTVKSVDYDKSADYCGDFMEMDIPEKFDVVWCSHVAEHQRNVGAFLEKLYDCTDGHLAIIVPVHPKERLIAGHVTAWGVYLLLYNLVLAGFDCRDARLLNDVELSAIVPRHPAERNPKWKNSVIGDPGEDPLESISKYFPVSAKQGAEIRQRGGINWSMEKIMLPNPATFECRFLPELLVFDEKHRKGYTNGSKI